MEIFERAMDGEIGSILILGMIGLFLMRFILKLLKFVIVQFPAIAGGLFFGLAFAAGDGVDLDFILDNPDQWEVLIPYFVPALAVAFVIWNVILSIIKAVLRSIFKSSKDTEVGKQTSQRAKQQKARQRSQATEGKAVTASKKSAMQTHKRHMDEYESRNKRIHEHELSHRDKNLNSSIVQRQRKLKQTVTRRVGA